MMDGFGGMGLVGAIVMLLVFGAVVLLIVWAVRAGIPTRQRRRDGGGYAHAPVRGGRDQAGRV
jgi:hypothetical protein